MEELMDGLYVSEPEDLGFGPSLQLRACLLRRDGGNILVYRSAGLDADEAERLGGVWRQYLNHEHEASPVTERVTERFGAPLHVHRDDAPKARRVARVDETFSGRHEVGDDFEVIPAPGHTPGATFYLWNSGGTRFLFTGDSIFFGEDGWRAAVLDGISDRGKYIESLERVRQDVDFDVLVPGVSRRGGKIHDPVGPEEAKVRIGGISARLREGADG